MKKISKYKNICWSVPRQKWYGKITVNGKLYRGGDYDDDKAAAKAIDLIIIKNNFDRPLQVLTKT